MSEPQLTASFTLPSWCERLDYETYRLHGNLLTYSVIPVLGIIPMTLRLLLGVVEAVVGLVFVGLSLCLLPCRPEVGTAAVMWSGKHVLQGLKRAVTAPLFAIPFVHVCFCYMSQKNRNQFV